MIKAIFIDMDDTLTATHHLYEEAKAVFRGYVRHFGVLPDDVKKAFNEIDKEHFKTYGYSRQRIPASFEAVLKHFVPDADAEMVETVRGFAEEIFSAVAPVKPGTPEAIELLVKHYPVYIVTAGDKGVQESRIQILPFKNSLAGAFIVDQKDKKTFVEILDRLGLNPEEAVMIGDSLKSDIIPPVAAGMQAVWIEEFNSIHEVATEFPKAGGAYKFSSLLEAARHITGHGTAAPAAKNTPRKKISPPKPG